MLRIVLVALVLLARAASAEPDPHRFAIATNAPLGWLAQSFAVSGYVGITPRHAIRANVASYPYIGAGFASLLADGFEGSSPTGRSTDVSLGWMYFHRRMLDGFTLELGVVGRSRYVDDWPEASDRVETNTKALLVRGLVGWSWLLRDRVFIAIAAGGAGGGERGHIMTTSDYDGSKMTEKVDRPAAWPEAYLRVGIALD